MHGYRGYGCIAVTLKSLSALIHVAAIVFQGPDGSKAYSLSQLHEGAHRIMNKAVKPGRIIGVEREAALPFPDPLIARGVFPLDVLVHPAFAECCRESYMCVAIDSNPRPVTV